MVSVHLGRDRRSKLPDLAAFERRVRREIARQIIACLKRIHFRRRDGKRSRRVAVGRDHIFEGSFCAVVCLIIEIIFTLSDESRQLGTRIGKRLLHRFVHREVRAEISHRRDLPLVFAFISLQNVRVHAVADRIETRFPHILTVCLLGVALFERHRRRDGLRIACRIDLRIVFRVLYFGIDGIIFRNGFGHDADVENALLSGVERRKVPRTDAVEHAAPCVEGRPAAARRVSFSGARII